MEQYAVSDTEHQSGPADSQRERDDCDDGRNSVLAELAKGVAEVHTWRHAMRRETRAESSSFYPRNPGIGVEDEGPRLLPLTGVAVAEFVPSI